MLDVERHVLKDLNFGRPASIALVNAIKRENGHAALFPSTAERNSSGQRAGSPVGAQQHVSAAPCPGAVRMKYDISVPHRRGSVRMLVNIAVPARPGTVRVVVDIAEATNDDSVVAQNLRATCPIVAFVWNSGIGRQPFAQPILQPDGGNGRTRLRRKCWFRLLYGTLAERDGCGLVAGWSCIGRSRQRRTRRLQHRRRSERFQQYLGRSTAASDPQGAKHGRDDGVLRSHGAPSFN